MANSKLPSEIQKYKNMKLQNMIHITNKLNENKELSMKFIDDVLKISGYEVDEEGYLVDYTNVEDESDKPDYVIFKGKALRLGSYGVLHSTDILFDAYANPNIMEFLFIEYIKETHPQVSLVQIFAEKEGAIPKGSNTYGYLKILYEDGSFINTKNHWKDSTKYLEGWCRLESMGNDMIADLLRPYDEWENEYYSNPENLQK